MSMYALRKLLGTHAYETVNNSKVTTTKPQEQKTDTVGLRILAMMRSTEESRPLNPSIITSYGSKVVLYRVFNSIKVLF